MEKKERGRPSKKEAPVKQVQAEKKEQEVEKSVVEEKAVVEEKIEKEPEAELVDEQQDQVSPDDDDLTLDENDIEDARDEELNADIKDEYTMLQEIGMSKEDLADSNTTSQSYNPLRPNVNKKPYSDGNPDGKSNASQEQQQSQQEQSGGDGGDGNDDIPDQQYEEIPEPKYNTVGESGSGAGKEDEDDDIGSGKSSDSGKSGKSEKLSSGKDEMEIKDGDDNFGGGGSKTSGGDSDKPTKAELKREAEKTADVILDTAEQLIPVPLMAIASYDMAKMSNLDMKDEIDLGMQVRKDGTTIEQYMMQHNEKCEAIFQISPQEREVIREPLIDVILEKEATLSPTARLGIAIGGVMLTKLYGAIKLATENKESLKTFKQFREEDKLAQQDKLEQQQRLEQAERAKVIINQPSQTTQTSSQASSQQPKAEKKEEKPLVMEDVLKDEDNEK